MQAMSMGMTRTSEDCRQTFPRTAEEEVSTQRFCMIYHHFRKKYKLHAYGALYV